MPSWSRVRRTGSEGCSISRMISSFSGAWYLMYRTPISQYAFFEQPVLQQQIGQQFFELPPLRTQVVNFVPARFPRGVARQALLTRLEELLGPAIVEVLVDPLLAAQLGHAVFATQTRDHDPNLVLGREVPPGRMPDVSYRLLCCFRIRLDLRSHRRSFRA